jgi:hypothetical protein
MTISINYITQVHLGFYMDLEDKEEEEDIRTECPTVAEKDTNESVVSL